MIRTSFITLQVLLLLHCLGEGLSISYQNQKKLEVQKHLKKLNKSPIKSIKSPDGDIIDCVDIFHQPAFDNPLLKNHTIQLTPSFRPKRVSSDQSKLVSNGGEKVAKISQLWQSKGKCPEGTIPIRRTKSEDVLRATSVLSYGKKKNIKHMKNILSKSPKSADLTETYRPIDYEHAVVYVKGVNSEKYYGAKATMNLQQPIVENPTEFSSSQMWLLAGPLDSDVNAIEAGWEVNPAMYGDNNTRLFSYWTNNAYHTGCYNHLCSGFVQTNDDVVLGATVDPVSTLDGVQVDAEFLIWKNPKNGDWWLEVDNNPLGYWPSTLFTHMNESASIIVWGGEVFKSPSEKGKHTATQMGSGLFPELGYGKSSYFNNIFIVDGSNNLVSLNGTVSFVEKPKCYDIVMGKNDDWNDYFYYGGWGRNPDCP